MHFKWNYNPPTEEQKRTAGELAEKIGMNPILTQLLVERGITTESAAKRFFRPQLADLINPFLMKDMDIAVDRLNDAMGRKERILVYGDYDVDGCTAVALVYKFLQQFYSNIEYYIPDRYDTRYRLRSLSKKPLFLFKAFVTSSMDIPLSCITYSIIDGSIAPERVPIISPSNGVIPIVVS